MSAKPGYAGKIARVDLSTGTISHIPTENYTQSFLGGQGLAARIYWEEVPPQVQALDPENRIIFATGASAGIEGLAGARWVVFGKSPATDPHLFSHCNLGGSWGAGLKAAGFDALVVQGKAEKPVYLFVQDGKIKIAGASNLWGKGAVEVRQMLKDEHGSSLNVVSTGLGGDNVTFLATLLADQDSSGSGSLGTILGSKNLKAIAVRGSGKVTVANPQRLQELIDRIDWLKKDANLVETVAADGSGKISCTGCHSECNRGVYQARDGTTGKFMCQSSSFYKEFAQKYYKEANEVPFFATRLCDHYGLNTKSIVSIISWLENCHGAGLLSDKTTGLPLDKIGSLEFIQALTAMVANRQGFGDVLAQGLHRAARQFGSKAEELVYDDITRAGDKLTYPPKVYLTTGILYATDPRQPIQQLHEVSRLALEWVRWAKKQPGANLSTTVFRAIARRSWGSEIAADFSTYEGKALAARMVQDRQLAKECLILCDSIFPILYAGHTPDHVGDPAIESKVFSAITGREMTEEQLYGVGERLLNLQRAILVREGHRGRQSDTLPEACFTVPLESERLNAACLMPGKNGEIFSRKGAIFEKEKFQHMLTEYYSLRGWDPDTGLQKKAGLEALGLSDVARDLSSRGLLS